MRKTGSWITSSRSSRFQWKSSESGGSDPVTQALAKMLKRVVSWSGDGFTWEADPRLMEELINMLNLSDGLGALTPGGKDIGKMIVTLTVSLSTPMPSLCRPLRDSNNTSPSTVQTLRTASRQRCSRCRSPRSSCSFAFSELVVT